MRRHVRHLMTLGSAVSLLLCLAACVLWARSYHVGRQVGYRAVDRAAATITRTSLATFAGRLSLSRDGVAGPVSLDRSGWFAYERNPGPTYAVDGFAGFEHRRVAGPGRWLWEVRVPLAAVAGLLAVPPALWVKAYRRRKRLGAPGVCRRCGYDLRATPRRCPECGDTPQVRADAARR